MYPGMYGPPVPDMYSRNFVHYDKFAGSDPILERPITVTGYSDLLNIPTGGYELIQPSTPTPRVQHGSPVYRERFDFTSSPMGSTVKSLLVTILLTMTVYSLMQLVGVHFKGLSSHTYLLLFIIFAVLWLGVTIAF